MWPYSRRLRNDPQGQFSSGLLASEQPFLPAMTPKKQNSHAILADDVAGPFCC